MGLVFFFFALLYSDRDFNNRQDALLFYIIKLFLALNLFDIICVWSGNPILKKLFYVDIRTENLHNETKRKEH